MSEVAFIGVTYLFIGLVLAIAYSAWWPADPAGEERGLLILALWLPFAALGVLWFAGAWLPARVGRKLRKVLNRSREI